MPSRPKDWPTGVKVAVAVAVAVLASALLTWVQGGSRDDVLETVTRELADGGSVPSPTSSGAGAADGVPPAPGGPGGGSTPAPGSVGSAGETGSTGSTGPSVVPGGSGGQQVVPAPDPSPGATGPSASGPGSGGTTPTAGASSGGASATTAPSPASGEVLPADVIDTICGLVRAAGAAPLRRGTPEYSPALDPDGNGLACE